MKEEIRTKTKKKIMGETEASLIEKGGKKRGSPFGGWLKRTIRFKTPKYNFSFSCVITND